MLTGLLRPTSGDAEIYGHSIVDDLKSVRPLIGVCPQQDVLFDKLTVCCAATATVVWGLAKMEIHGNRLYII